MSIPLISGFVVLIHICASFELHDIVRIHNDVNKEINLRLAEIMRAHNGSYDIQVFGSFDPIYSHTINVNESNLKLIQNFNQSINPFRFKRKDFVQWKHNPDILGEIQSIFEDDSNTYVYAVKFANKTGGTVLNISHSELKFLPKFTFIEYRPALVKESLLLPVLEGSASSKHLNAFVLTDYFDQSMIEDNVLSFLSSNRSKCLHNFPRILGVKDRAMGELNKFMELSKSDKILHESVFDILALGSLSSTQLESMLTKKELRKSIRPLSKPFIKLVKKLHSTFQYQKVKRFLCDDDAYVTLLCSNEAEFVAYKRKLKERQALMNLISEYCATLQRELEVSIELQLDEISARLNASISPNFIIISKMSASHNAFVSKEEVKDLYVTEYLGLRATARQRFSILFDRQIILHSNKRNENRKCNSCGRKDVKLLKCEGCKRVYYCNGDCQRRDTDHDCLTRTNCLLSSKH